jgi:hypothetical protein
MGTSLQLDNKNKSWCSTLQQGNSSYHEISVYFRITRREDFLAVLEFEFRAFWASTLPLEPHPNPFCSSYFSTRVSHLCPAWAGLDRDPIYAS